MKKTINYNTKISKIEKKVSDHNHSEYITTPEFNILAASVFNTRVAHLVANLADLVAKTDFDAKLKKLVTELLQIKQNIYLLQMN